MLRKSRCNSSAKEAKESADLPDYIPQHPEAATDEKPQKAAHHRQTVHHHHAKAHHTASEGTLSSPVHSLCPFLHSLHLLSPASSYLIQNNYNVYKLVTP
jgi:hypothetical protein